MADGIAPFGCTGQRVGITHVAVERGSRQTALRGRASEDDGCVSVGHDRADDRLAQVSRSTGDQDTHDTETLPADTDASACRWHAGGFSPRREDSPTRMGPLDVPSSAKRSHVHAAGEGAIVIGQTIGGILTLNSPYDLHPDGKRLAAVAADDQLIVRDRTVFVSTFLTI